MRLAAAGPPAAVAARLAGGSGRDRMDLARAVRAWGHGGAAALAVLEEEWHRTPKPWPAPAPSSPPPGRRTSGRGCARRATAGRRSATDAQLRYGRDGRWWPYRKERGRWWPAGPPAQDPAAALAMLASD